MDSQFTPVKDPGSLSFELTIRNEVNKKAITKNLPSLHSSPEERCYKPATLHYSAIKSKIGNRLASNPNLRRGAD